MNAPLQIRQARIEDSPAIARVQVDSHRAAYRGLLPAAYLDRFTYAEQTLDWRDLLSARQDSIVHVAQTGAEIVGYALARPGPTGTAPYDGELVALHVLRAHQRRGIGRRLFAAAAAQLREQGCSALLLWVLAGNTSRSFYERLGGIVLGQHEAHLDEDVVAVEVAYGWPDVEGLCARLRAPTQAAIEGGRR